MFLGGELDDASGLGLLEEGASGGSRLSGSLDGRRLAFTEGRRGPEVEVDGGLDEEEAVGGTEGLGGDGDLLLRGSDVLLAGPLEDLEEDAMERVISERRLSCRSFMSLICPLVLGKRSGTAS